MVASPARVNSSSSARHVVTAETGSTNHSSSPSPSSFTMRAASGSASRTMRVCKSRSATAAASPRSAVNCVYPTMSVNAIAPAPGDPLSTVPDRHRAAAGAHADAAVVARLELAVHLAAVRREVARGADAGREGDVVGPRMHLDRDVARSRQADGHRAAPRPDALVADRVRLDDPRGCGDLDRTGLRDAHASAVGAGAAVPGAAFDTDAAGAAPCVEPRDLLDGDLAALGRDACVAQHAAELHGTRRRADEDVRARRATHGHRA